MDGAENWEKVPLPRGVNGPNGIAIDPVDPNRLYLAAWGRSTPDGAVGGGIFVSADAGKSWHWTLSEDQHVYAITMDPRLPGTAYASGFESSAWRTTNHGESWQRIKGFNFKWGHRVMLDPQDPNMIFVTTYGGSVWYGPAAGDPNAVEDVATPGLTYGSPRSGQVYSVGGNVSQPVPIYKPDPPYSDEARKAKYQGMVVLWIIVDSTGAVTECRVVKPLGYGLDEEAVKAVSTWKFQPAMRDGSPVPVHVMVAVKFTLFKQ